MEREIGLYRRPRCVFSARAYHLAVVFDQAMRLDEILAHRFDVRPEVGLPTSAVADRGGLRVVLFDTARWTQEHMSWLPVVFAACPRWGASDIPRRSCEKKQVARLLG